jgi:hypothetical protein
MGVRNIFPNSIAFAISLRVHGKQLRVEVILDLQDRLLFVPSGILPEIVDRLGAFTQQMGELTAEVLAQQRWDGKDPMTQYQSVTLLPGYRINRSQLGFNVLLGDSSLLPVDELEGRSSVDLEEGDRR